MQEPVAHVAADDECLHAFRIGDFADAGGKAGLGGLRSSGVGFQLFEVKLDRVLESEIDRVAYQRVPDRYLEQVRDSARRKSADSRDSGRARR